MSGAALLQASLAGDVEEVIRLLDRGAIVNYHDADLMTSLQAASKAGHQDIVALLLLRDANVNARNSNGRTALHHACYAGFSFVAIMLMEKNADIRAITDAPVCDTPLHVACYRGHEIIAAALLERGAAIDAQNMFDETALHIATKRGHERLASFLVAKGASIGCRDVGGMTPLDVSCSESMRHVLLDTLHGTSTRMPVTPDVRAATSSARQVMARVSTERERARRDAYERMALAAEEIRLQGIREDFDRMQRDLIEKEAQIELQKSLMLAEPTQICLICSDSVKSSDGTCCTADENHFTCRTCVDGQTTYHSGEGGTVGTKGGVGCTRQNCKGIYSDQALARTCSAEAFALYTKARDDYKEALLCIDYERRLEDERQRILHSTAEEAHLANARKHIQENILTTKCPKCTKAFVDFVNCFAITCKDERGHGCGAGFCGFCLELCGSDAHAHVANCPKNINPGKNVYAAEGRGLEVFNAAQKARQSEQVRAYLAAMAPEKRELVVRGCAADLAGLNITAEARKEGRAAGAAGRK